MSNYNFPEAFKDFKKTYLAERHPIFLDSEWDYTPTCDACNETIDVSLINSKSKKTVSLNVSL